MLWWCFRCPIFPQPSINSLCLTLTLNLSLSLSLSLSLHLHLSYNLSLCVTIFPSSSPSSFRCKNMSNVSSWKYEHVYDLREANGIFLIMFQVEVKVVSILCLHQKYMLYLNKYGYTVCHEIEKGCIIVCDFLLTLNQHNALSNITIGVTQIIRNE